MQVSTHKMGGEAEIHPAYLRGVAPAMTMVAAILNLIWRRQVLRFLAFLVNYLTLISKYGCTWCVHPIIHTLKLAVLRFSKESSVESSPTAEHRKSNNSGYQDIVHCQVLHDPGESATTVDVIFIHGLHGSLVKTWRQGDWGRGGHSPIKRVLRKTVDSGLDHAHSKDDDDSEPYASCWPKQWLPQDCPGARVIALDYTTDPYLWRPVWISKQNRSCLVMRSKEMTRQLRMRGVGNRPIVWVGHSKGGLYVKQMLVNEFESGTDDAFCRNTRGILFYSVPHRGSALALIDPPLLRQSIELTEVAKDSPKVLDLHLRFLSLCEHEHFQVEFVSFFETKRTLMSIVLLRIVAPESADLEFGELCGVHLDHRQICKPRSRNCFLYRSLTNLIHRVVV